MADPIDCLRGTTIFIALWNILYSVLQIAIFGWQTKYCKDRQWEFENRQLPADGAIDGFQARFPGLYGILTETPERRRIKALFAIAIATLIVSLAHLILSIMLLFGSITKRINFVWPWFFSALPIIILSTAYAVIWWSGDIFGTQLVMSVTEFVASLAINSICFVIVLMFFFRLKGSLRSSKPVEDEDHFKSPFKSAPGTIPPWRSRWSAKPPEQLAKKIARKRRKEQKSSCRTIRQSYRSHAKPVRIPDTSIALESDGQRQRLTADRLAEHNRILSGKAEASSKYSYEGRTDRNTVL